MCDCKVCTETRLWKDGLSDPQLRDGVFEEMLSRIEHSETEATHYREILAGRWPDSVGILERALKNAKSFSSKD